jgi:hypothetical protein
MITNLTAKTGLITKSLIISLLIVIILNIIVVQARFGLGYESHLFDKVFKKLYVDNEQNLPTFYNTFLLLVATGLLYLIFLINVKNIMRDSRWFVLACIFTFLSVDENASIHEFFDTFMPEYVGVGGNGAFTFAWVIPYGAVLILLVIYLLSFLRDLPRKIAIGFAASGLIYVTGAIGFEMIGAEIVSTVGSQNLTYAWMATVEETFEMTGIILFIYYLLAYIKLEFGSFTIHVS